MREESVFSTSPGYAVPFGATVIGDGINFCIFSRYASRVVLDLYKNPSDTIPFQTFQFDSSENKTGDMWHLFVKGLKPGALYLYHVDGPYIPEKGFFYNFNTPLIDPHAKALSEGSVFKAYKWDKNSFPDMSLFPKCVVVDDHAFDWEGDRPLNYPMAQTIIYETHLKGYTQSPTSGVKFPGTYKGFIEKIPYLKDLGITTVEFLPVYEFDEFENNFKNPRTGRKLQNFWGYSTISFFAPKFSYSSQKKPGACVTEFKTLVKELHRAGIEVVLDVVYNHTAEGNENGLTISFRGFDNRNYYILDRNRNFEYLNFSGCGNTFNCNNPPVSEFIIESLRYWVLQMHIDGFRFDLAAILGRNSSGNPVNPAPILDFIAEDPVLSSTKIIAEPWDAAGSYRLGWFPSRWSEWNDHFRDDIKKFIRGDEHLPTYAATRISGSSDIFEHSGKKTFCSVNFISCHDGFTLNDMVSYNSKHNEQNGENNNDGSNNNLSYNYGYEGCTENVEIESIRLNRIKNFLFILFVSQGVPMICAGDEFRRTQIGNNNAYCQNNEISWVDWTFPEKNKELFLFTKKMIQLRKNHPVFRREVFFEPDKDKHTDQPEIQWFDQKGETPDWSVMTRFLSFKLSGKNFKQSDASSDNDFYVAANTDNKELNIQLPILESDKKWEIFIDTSAPESSKEDYEIKTLPLDSQGNYKLKSYAFIILMSKNK